MSEDNTAQGPNGERIPIVVVAENIFRRGVLAFSKGDRVHSASAKDLGINLDGTDAGEQASAAHATSTLPSASAEFPPHPAAQADALAAAQKAALLPNVASPDEEPVVPETTPEMPAPEVSPTDETPVV